MTGVEIGTLIGVVSALGLLWKIYSEVTKAKGQFVAEIKREIAADAVTKPTRHEIWPQPFVTKEADEFITKKEHAAGCSLMERRVVALEGRTHAIEQQMQTDKKEILQAGENRAVLIHDQISEIDRKLAAVNERSESTQSELRLLNQNIMSMLRERKTP
jgi:hypothetical protein